MKNCATLPGSLRSTKGWTFCPTRNQSTATTVRMWKTSGYAQTMRLFPGTRSRVAGTSSAYSAVWKLSGLIRLMYFSCGTAWGVAMTAPYLTKLERHWRDFTGLNGIPKRILLSVRSTWWDCRKLSVDADWVAHFSALACSVWWIKAPRRWFFMSRQTMSQQLRPTRGLAFPSPRNTASGLKVTSLTGFWYKLTDCLPLDPCVVNPLGIPLRLVS